MTYLVLGILTWSAVHFVPALSPGLRQSMVSRLGEYGYKALFALAMFGAIALIIFGWKSALPSAVYMPPRWGNLPNLVLVLFTFTAFFAPYVQSNLSRLTRHPQLMGVAAWGIGHLLVSGDSRSLVLFGGLTLWALAEILLINRREGAWQKPGKAPLSGDFKLLLTGIGFYIVFLYTHAFLFGVSAVPAP